MPSKENSSSNFWNERADHMQFITDELPHALLPMYSLFQKTRKPVRD